MFARLFDNPVAVVILVLIVVVVFGWKKLPDAARSLGRSTRILKSELDGMNGESKASNETVRGETSQYQQGQGAHAAGRVPGESSAQAPNDQPTHGQSQQDGSGQGPTSGQGGPQAG